MTELENIKSLERYDNGKKAKRSRTRGIKFFATLIGCSIGLLLTGLILKVSVGDTGTLTKATFTSEDKVMEHVPKIDEIDKKLKKSIVSSPLKGLSKKVEEDTAKEIVKGNVGAIITAIRTYCIILIVIGFLVLAIIGTIFYGISYGIIGSFVGLEPTLSEQEI